jgi:hypothetical protein
LLGTTAATLNSIEMLKSFELPGAMNHSFGSAKALTRPP